jgi:predicted nucleic acid-binding protein
MPLILLDTNVLVYTCDPGEPIKRAQAGAVLRACEQAGNGRLSVQCLSEFVAASTRRLKPPLTIVEANRQVERLSQSLPVFDLTPMIVLEALRGVREHGLSYYDAQIWAAARLNQVPVIFSEDFNSNSVLDGVRFVNPFSAEFDLTAWV